MMWRRALLIFGLGLLPATLATSADQSASTKPAVDLYEGFAADVGLLRDTYEVKSPSGVIRGSSGKSQEAARRIFSNVAFLHRSRAEVLDLLGDPKTISDYGRAVGKEKDAPLVYCFDSGFGGPMYTLGFGGDHCISVAVEFLN